MHAEIIAVGSELLTPSRVDTNSLWLTGQLNELGVELICKGIIGDDCGRLAGAVSLAVERADIVIITGGLGPTEDDLTRDAVAQALGRPLAFSQEICDDIEGRFRDMGRKMAEINKRQAYVIEGAEVLHNDNGTAPGLWIKTASGGLVILMPGPPRELKPLFKSACMPRLRQLVPRLSIRTRQYRVSAMAESDLDQLIAPVYKEYDNVETTVLASPGDIQIHLRARCETAAEADAILAEVGPRIEELLGDRIYSCNGDSLEATVGELLKQAGATLAVAESCTGGRLAQTITSVPGASAYFAGGFLVYSAEQKRKLLDVAPELIEEHTVVSREVAAAMAVAAREKTGATYAISVTGEAGPDTATDNPAGTVFISLAGPGDTIVKRFRFLGDRERVRLRAVRHSLDLLRQTLKR
jgi:competence/damage-inducible protein CinA-like protein